MISSNTITCYTIKELKKMKYDTSKIDRRFILKKGDSLLGRKMFNAKDLVKLERND